MIRAPRRGYRPDVRTGTPRPGGHRTRPIPRGTTRVVLLATLAIAASATAAFGGVLEDRLGAARSEAKEAKQELGVVDQRQKVAEREVSRLNDRIAQLERPLHDLEQDVEQLEYRMRQREKRITELKRERELQRLEIIRLERELGAARQQLAVRVVAAYKAGDTGMVEQLAAAGDLRDLFRREEALSQVVGLDERVIARISTAERSVRVKRARNVQVRLDIKRDIDQLDSERAEAEAQRVEAQRRRDEVAVARDERDAALRALNAREEKIVSRLDDLEEDAKVLEDVIKNGSTTYSGQLGSLSASGLIWPVSGSVVSPFGQRWGRLHAGIDIAIPAGNPIHAAASGVVTYAGWMSGYGNMVIIQHAGSLSTGYAHQSQIATSVGQLVSQGQVIGFIGCTGHCYGDHLHFETRIDGNATDPMQYL